LITVGTTSLLHRRSQGVHWVQVHTHVKKNFFGVIYGVSCKCSAPPGGGKIQFFEEISGGRGGLE